MHAFDKRTIETVETADEIQFIVRRSNGWAIPGVLCLLFLITLSQFFRATNITAFFIAFVLAIVLAAALVKQILRGKKTILTAWRDRISAEGDLGNLSSQHVVLKSSSFQSLGYMAGDAEDNAPSGLYAWRGTPQQCLIPELNRKECEQIVNAIYFKFPSIGCGDSDSASLLFDENGGLIRLGLDK
ncbi:hypothetical protein [Silvibacterium dinghuense]|uniref:Uncharacterized protein n=1 Tax=Silvibacterium dinghuense TaxID=1560006 RepID=A0A4Q1SIP9_9BACT|nr:hypothetical protein [Silvibacterium dinghuense]RXS97283.1 hypothetical protein ESZ00_05065 [Silvibacterium dinghuense]